ncbi:MAG TPA: hypothetical protein PKA82_13235 [Pyrinomonadaceae bacterium]|nr:hypothetical protein [Pyrinomonadaceae bacterium]
MYEVDNRDKVVKLDGVPQSSVGAPIPTVLSNERMAVVAFYLHDTPDDWDGNSVRIVGVDSEEPAAIIEFKWCYAHMFGPPNDEAFEGHPLYERGLMPYGAYEIIDSSWIRKLERMNSVHRYHNSERFLGHHHYIFAFHDSTFECVADGFEITETSGSMESLLPIMAEKLWAS